jgi:LysR family transcriptional regulator of abg operon
MKFTHIRDVIAVAERGSLRAAARYLGVQQPAITRSIQEVERALGAVLFERHTRGVITTPVGEAFLRRAVIIQNELRLAQEEVDQLQGMTSGQVSIVLSTVAHLVLLPRALERFRKRFPNIELRVIDGVITTYEAAVADGTVDFYVGPSAELPPASHLAVEKLFDNSRVILARKGHPLAGASSLKELVGAKWISTTVTVDGDAELGPVFGRHSLPHPSIEMRGSSALTLIVGAASSDLLIMVPEQWLLVPTIHDLLHHIKIAEPLPGPFICIVRRANLPLTPAAEYMCDMLRWASQNYVVTRAHGKTPSVLPVGGQ